MTDNTYKFDLPSHHKSIIKVIGVGGGGSNAVNYMYKQGINDVEFIVCNTDAQALKISPVPNKLQIGNALTEGLGAGANPEKGRDAALESRDQIRELLDDGTKMVFITAGMGGGTGTGAAPVIAKIAKEMDILTVGIVTAPFSFEGRKKRQQADLGISELRSCCDTVLVILNDKLREIFGNLSISQAFAQADNVLTTAAKGIAEIITVPGYVNVDFEDVKTVMSDSGAAVMGSAQTVGDRRAIRAAEEALSSPLLNNKDIDGAQKILLSIVSGEEAELQMDELSEITEYIQEKAGDNAEVIFGHGVDNALGDHIRVTVIATGFDRFEEEGYEEVRKVVDLETSRPVAAPKPEVKPAAYTMSNPVAKPVVPKAPAPTFEVDRPDKEERKVVLNLEGDYIINDATPAEPAQPKYQEPPKHNELEERKRRLMEQAKDRVERLKGLSRSSIDSADLKDLDEPAYLRKKVDLKDVPHSSDRNISRFNLTDDNEILGNNKFLHDNID
jgi:cell division protein FtsZ